MFYALPKFRVAAIAELCQSRGVSQAKLARLCGVTRQTLNLWAHGRCQPQFDTILLLCARLGVDPTFFAEGLNQDKDANNDTDTDETACAASTHAGTVEAA